MKEERIGPKPSTRRTSLSLQEKVKVEKNRSLRLQEAVDGTVQYESHGGKRGGGCVKNIALKLKVKILPEAARLELWNAGTTEETITSRLVVTKH